MASKGQLLSHQTSGQEMGRMRALVERDLKDAALTGLSSDRCFATAYNAVLQLATMLVYCSGYRISTSRGGHHLITFEALRYVLGRARDPLVDYFDTCRRKRNQVDYDHSGIASGMEAEELLEKAREFEVIVEEWISRNHSQFSR